MKRRFSKKFGVVKRVASLFMVISMVFQLLPLTSYAAMGEWGPVGENLAVNGSFEESLSLSAGNIPKFWSDGVYPVGWDGIWDASGNSQGKIQLSLDSNEAFDGERSVHVSANNESARLEFLQYLDDYDTSKDYFCMVMVKAENVTGNGFYMRVSVTKAGGGGTIAQYYAKDQMKISGTTDGWVPFMVHIKDLPVNAGKIQFDMFIEYMKGNLWLDDMQMVSTYRFTLEEESETIYVDDEITLTPVYDTEGIQDEILWRSSDEDVAIVDEEGTVTAVGSGVAEIYAEIDEYHAASCSIIVEDESIKEQYTSIRQKWSDRLTGNPVFDETDPDLKEAIENIDETASGYWESMEAKPEGKDDRTTLWSDLNLTVNYVASSNSALTAPLQSAFDRVERMALAYSAVGSRYYQNEGLKDAIIDALEWLHANVYNKNYNVKEKLYGNWYHWQIGIPQSLANTVILMYEELPVDLIKEEAEALAKFNEDPNYVYKVQNWGKMDMTSANLLDTSLVSVLRSAIGEEPSGISMVKAAFSKVLPYVSSGDGFYLDGSCIQHTNLAYTGGYGSTLLNGMNKILLLTDETSWMIADEQVINVYDWILEGYRPLFADGAIMDMVSGRGIARPSRNEQTAGRGILLPIVHLYQTAPEDLKEQIGTFARTQILAGFDYNPEYFKGLSLSDIASFKGFLNNNSTPSEESADVYHKNFGAMDKVVHHGKDFTLGISMYSKRMGSFEYGNGENLKGYHTADGAVYLYNKDPGQYAENYWPTVDPMRLAGITTDHTEGTISTTWNAHVSTKDWVGGSSVLGTYGSTGMEFEAENSTLTGKKSWFSFDDEVVALGTGIRSGEEKPVETIVENRKIQDDGSNSLIVDSMAVGSTINSPEEKTNCLWAWLEGNTNSRESNIGYYFPEETVLTVLKENRTGSWRDINSAISEGSAAAQPIDKMYASLAIPHGTRPQDGEYCYVLLPGKSQEDTKTYSQNPNIKVLSNSDDVQAVREETLGVTGMNFWNPSVLEEFEALTPASVTVHKNGSHLTLGISNPTQNYNTTKIKINGIYKVVSSDSKVSCVSVADGIEISINTKDDHGKTYSVELQAVDVSEFDTMYERIYKQTIGFSPESCFPTGNSYIEDFITTVDADSQKYWDLMNKKEDTNRTEIFNGIKPVLQGGPNENSAALTTTYKYLNKLVQAYYTEGTALYQREGLIEEVISALDFILAKGWYGKDTPKNSGTVTYYGNWWDHRIGVPAQLLPILTMMYKEKALSPDCYQSYMEAMKYQKAHDWTGYNSANLADIGLNAMYIGILEKDYELLNKMNIRFGQELFSYATGKNGWYPDGSYIDHDKYAYTGGYGSVLVSAMSRILPILSETGYEMAFGDEKDDFYSDIIFKGYLPLHSAGTLTDSVRGRSITRQTGQRSTSAGHLAVISGALEPNEKRKLQSVIKGWLQEDPDIMKYLTRPAELIACEEILENPEITAAIPENAFYSYNYMDKAVQQTENYKAVVSMHSNVIANYEHTNTEGKKLWNISDGALFLYNGDLNQYREDYWPTVDKHRLAGTTVMHNTDRTEIAGTGTFNPNSWVSSIGLGEIGVAGMQLKGLGASARDGAFAKKSYFMFDNEIVAVGSDIKNLSTNLNYNIETIIENRKINDDLSNVLTVNGTVISQTGVSKNVDEAGWAHLEGNDKRSSTGYVFPEKTSIHVLKESRSGYWQDINGLPGMRTSDDEVSRAYATMYIDHGIRPDAAGYSYILLPGRTADETIEYEGNPDVIILDDSISVHAVKEKNLLVTAANFWTSQETSTSDGKLTASRFATVLLKEKEGSFELAIADPIHTSTEKLVVKVAIPTDGVISKDENIAVVSKGEYLVIEIDVRGAAKDKVFNAEFAIAPTEEEKNDALLDSLYKAADEILLYTDVEKLDELLGTVSGISDEAFTEAQKESLTALLQRLKDLKADMSKAALLAEELGRFTEVDEENAELVEALLLQYQELTQAQKSLFPEETSRHINHLENLLNQWKGRIYAVGITVRKKPDKIVYESGEELNPDGIEIAAKFNDGSEELVYSWTLSGYDKGITGVQTITVSWEGTDIHEEQKIFTAVFTVTVKAKQVNEWKSNGFVIKQVEKVYPASTGDKNNWRKDSIGWWLAINNGGYAASEWKQIDGRWYFFNADGYMVTGWRQLDKGNWYYMNADGYMAVGWVFDSGHWYYLAADGAMVYGPILYQGKQYLFNQSGACINP